MLIIGAGALTPMLMHSLPIAGGGSSLMLVLTVPITVTLCILLLVYFLLRQVYQWDQKSFDKTLFVTTLISLFISLAFFPYG